MPTTEPSGVLPLRGSPASSDFGLGGELGDEGVGDLVVDHDALGRHADLALVHEGAERGRVHRFVEVGVVEHDQRRLAAELEQHRLQIFRRDLGDDPADVGRAGEIDAPDRGMVDQRLDQRRRILRRVGDDVDDARRQPGLAKASTISPWVRGQISEALRTTVLPQASGTAIARTPRMIGAFHGAMPSITPTGWRIAIAMQPGLSDGITSPAICVVIAAASRTMPAASMTLKPAQPAVAPVSAIISATNCVRLGCQHVGGL